MKFIDEVTITIISGRGGDGCVAFRRESHVPFGGPSGGNGGKGGDVFFRANEGVNTLVKFRGRKVMQAQEGDPGSGSQRDGHTGKDLYIDVPVGTLIKTEDGQVTIKDMLYHGEVFLAAKGGRGGLGNNFFKSSTNQAPKYAQDGGAGVELKVHLELKLLADVALIGLPNAGKSTLISVISAARPKIADYPFTTLTPNLGVVERNGEDLVVADIPGLIEKASEGKGLGVKFLKHIERTRALVHLVDISWCLEPYEAYESYQVVRGELLKYGHGLENRPEIICLTKIDALTDEEILEYQDFFEKQLDKKVLPISAVSSKNIDHLKILMFKTKRLKAVEATGPDTEAQRELT